MINETAQTAYSAATNKEQEMDCKCEHWPDWVCKSNAKAEPTAHKHAAMIAEWIKNVWRPIERKMQNGSWLIDDTVTWQIHFEYRFADQVTPVKHEIVSSLTDEYFESVIIKNRDGIVTGREIANAAAKRAHAEGYQSAIDDVCAMSSESSLSNQKVTDLYNEIDDNTRARMCIANKAIAQFQADVKKLLGGV